MWFSNGKVWGFARSDLVALLAIQTWQKNMKYPRTWDLLCKILDPLLYSMCSSSYRVVLHFSFMFGQANGLYRQWFEPKRLIWGATGETKNKSKILDNTLFTQRVKLKSYPKFKFFHIDMNLKWVNTKVFPQALLLLFQLMWPSQVLHFICKTYSG